MKDSWLEVICGASFGCWFALPSEKLPVSFGPWPLAFESLAMKWMPQSTLRFRILQDGRVEESVEGVVGETCLQLTERIEAALGAVEQRRPTAEAFLLPQDQSQTIPAELF